MKLLPAILPGDVIPPFPEETMLRGLESKWPLLLIAGLLIVTALLVHYFSRKK